MRIINIMFGKGLGGLEQVSVDYHNALASQNHDVLTILRKGAKIVPPEQFKDQFLNMSLFLFPNLITGKLQKIISDFQPDALLLHGNRPLKYLGHQKSFATPRIFIAHNYRAKPNVQNMTGVIAVSSPVRDHIISTGFPADQVHVVNNMTDMQVVERPEMDETCPRLGMLARLHPVKGVDLFLEALGQLKKEGINFKARIAGDGPELQNLQTLAKRLNILDDIDFPGWVNNKAEFFKSIDILVAPSRSEAFPVLIVEALSAGIPLIVSDLKGPCSVLTDKEHALIVPTEDPSAITKSLKCLIQNASLRQQMIENQRDQAQQFTIEAVTKRLCKSIKKIIGSNTN